MPLVILDAKRVQVGCDTCKIETAEVYGKLDWPVMATVAAIRKFKSIGWQHDPGRPLRPDLVEEAERTGRGRWHCAKCANGERR